MAEPAPSDTRAPVEALSAFEALSTLDAPALAIRPWRPERIVALSAWDAASAAALAAFEAGLFGASAVAGRALAADGLHLLPIAPRRRLLVIEPGGPALAEPPARPAFALVTMTGAFRGLTLAGPAAADLLARFVAIDLQAEAFPDGACAATRFEGVAVHLLRPDADRFAMLCPASLADHVATLLATGARACGADPDPAWIEGDPEPRLRPEDAGFG